MCPLGINRSDPNHGGTSYRNGTPITEPHDFGNDVTWPTPDPAHFGNSIPSSGTNQNTVNWVPSPAHFGNIIAPPYPAPTFISVTPNHGPAAGGTPLAIVGTNFIAPVGVSIGGNPCTSVVIVDAEHITCDSPAGTASTDTDLEIIAAGGMIDTPDAFSYDAAGPAFVVGAAAFATSKFDPASPAITTGVDTTGANFLVAVCAGYDHNQVPVLTDTIGGNPSGNTWTQVSGVTWSSQTGAHQILYCYNAAVGPNHVFHLLASAGGGDGTPGIAVAAFQGMPVTDPFESVDQNSLDGNPPMPSGFTGVTPASVGDLIIIGLSGINTTNPNSGAGSEFVVTVDTGGTLASSTWDSNTPDSAASWSKCAIAYLVTTGTSPLNPNISGWNPPTGGFGQFCSTLTAFAG